jgi:glycosyltransferase involved in cell wall biosynthesis
VKRGLTFAVPGSLDTPTGGYAYDRRIIGELRGMGWDVEVLDLGDGFPYVDDARSSDAQSQLARAAAEVPLVVDGLALGVLPEAAANLRNTHRLIALVHHPLAFESGLSFDEQAALKRSERQALARVAGVIVTSDMTKTLLLSHYGVAAEAVAVVRPGNDRVEAAQGRGEPLSLLAVGSIVPRKGYDVLIAALAMVKDLPWTLTVAGDCGRDGATAARLDNDIARHDLQSRVSLAGAVTDERLAGFYREADIFVLASRFEGYGMALADAIAYGLPVVATRAGAIPEAVASDASILVAPDDPAALATALRKLIGNKSEREMLADNARRAAAELPSWRDQALLFARAIEAHA